MYIINLTKHNPCNMMKAISTFHLLLVITLMMLETTNGQLFRTRKSQPNIIFILADDLGWNDVSWHNPLVQMPNMESLAKSGIILEQSYVLPTCTPTRAALLTGKHPHTYGRQSGVIKPMKPVGIPLRFKLLPQVLKEAGYTTHAVGKWHLGFCSSAYTPTERGFDTFYGYYSGSQGYYTHSQYGRIPREDRMGCFNKECYEFGLDFYNGTTPDPTQKGIYSTHVFASHVENLLNSRSSKKPFFLYMAFQSVHSPLEVPPEYALPFQYIKDRKRRTYLGMVSAMDEAIGRVVQALKTSGHYHNSIIIFSTDNGGGTGKGGNNWPLCGKKGTNMEGGTRGVAFVHSPLLNNSFTSHKLLHVTDWFKTLVNLAGGKVPANLDGFDQWKALSVRTAPSPRKKMVYNIRHLDFFNAGVRKGSFKLLIGVEKNCKEWSYPAEHTAIRGYQHGRDIKFKSLSDAMISYNIYKMKPRQNVTLVTDVVSSYNNSFLLDLLDGDSAIQSTSNVSEVTSFVNNVYGNISYDIKPSRMVSTAGINTKESQNREHHQRNKTLNRLRNTTSNRLRNNTYYRDGASEGRQPKQNEPETENKKRRERIRRKKNRVKNHRNNENKKNNTDNDWVTFAEIGIDIKNYDRLKDFLNRNTKISLFNIKNDPSEQDNLAKVKVGRVKALLRYLHHQMKHFVPAKILPDEPKANPRYWNNAWSPGWCQAV